ncbi:7TM diverse intracellular signaling [Leptospira broomii serovar Hurstbridge str. 5399]|uniref:7TM diverse intracellular signaling n=2 Tax=Leptospira broomii TaxID=301541 RepID=T0GJS0_9LEPT|nr:7TM diverse intracellular signaling [Leptospira broomii serovar Hurstbridge str. 5399]
MGILESTMEIGKRSILLRSIIFLLSFHTLPVLAFDTFKIPSNGIPLSNHSEVWEDSGRSTPYPQVLKIAEFQPVSSPSFGYSSSAYWFSIPVENSGNETLSWILEIRYAYLDKIEVYQASGSSHPIYRAGDSISFKERPIFYRFPSFPFEIPPHSTDRILIRIETTSAVNFAAFAYKRQDFFSKVNSEQILQGLYFGAILVMVLYNLFLFLSTKEKIYFAFSAYVAAGIFVQWIMCGYASQFFWPGATTWASRCVASFTFLSVATAADFIRTYFDTKRRHPRFNILILGVVYSSAFLTVAGYFLPVRVGLALYFPIAFLGLICLVSVGFQNLSRNLKYAAFFLGAWFALIIGTFLYLLKFSGILPHTIGIVNWGVEIGSVLHVLLIAMSLADRVNELSINLTNKVGDLNNAKHAIEQSEMRFRNLFEGAEELLLTLDQEGKIQDANRTLSRLTGHRPAEVKGKSLLDLIYSPEGPEGSLNLFLAKEKLEEHLKLRKTVEFHSEFSQKYVMEPKPVKIRLQSFDAEGTRMVLGKVSEISEDILSRFLQSESMNFTVNNYLRNADILSRQLTANLTQFVGSEVVTAVRICLREVLINAIEHGNLGISFDEKTDAMKSGNYMEFIQKRQKEVFYGARSVKVAYSLNSKRIGFEIYDEGEGFDFKKILNLDGEKLNEQSYTHGRGIMMTRKVFDVVKFNDKGNKVLLIKYLQKPLKYKREPSSFDI